MALERFGNRLPQLNFEVFRAVDDFEKEVKAVNLIPSAGEFVYDTDDQVHPHRGRGETVAENRAHGGGRHGLGKSRSISSKLSCRAPAMSRWW